MNGAATDFGSAFEYRFVNVVTVETFAAERWNQRRVNVDDFVLEVARNLNQTEEPSENYKVNLGFATKIKDPIAEGLDRVKLRAHNGFTFQSGVASTFDSAAIFLAGDDDWKLGIQLPRSIFFEQIYQRRTATGNQNCQTNGTIERLKSDH